MKTTSLLNKKLALGLATAGLAATGSILFSADSAEAVRIKFNLDDVTASDGGAFTGSFVYNSNNPDLFEDFNIQGTPGAAVTFVTSYVSPAAESPSPFLTVNPGGFPGNSGTFLTVQDDTSGFPRSSLALEFDTDLTTLSVGDTANIELGNTGLNFRPSFELYELDQRDSQARSLTGGTVIATEVPEPLTILGTLVAGGIGAAMKKKRQVS